MSKHNTTSYNTRKMISDAFINLLSSKSMQKISVKEITDSCKVNRQTFYYHFNDMYDLLKWTIHELASNVLKEIDTFDDWETSMIALLKEMQNRQKIVFCVYSSLGRDELKKILYKDLYTLTQEGIEKRIKKNLPPSMILNEEKMRFVTQFYTVAFGGMTEEWIIGGMKEPPEKLVSMLVGVVNGGLEATIKQFISEQPIIEVSGA